jgi:glucose/arabinose dehydrogenase
MSRRLRALVPLAILAAPLLGQLPPGFRLELVTAGIADASAFAFAPDGRVFLAERVTGNVRALQNGQLGGAWAVVPKSGSASSEIGLVGIAVHPSFAPRRVYTHYTAAGAANPAVIAHYTEAGGVGTNPTLIGPSVGSTAGHVGGPLGFGRDGKLYVARGDGTVPLLAQMLGGLHGKMLRMNDDGTVPADNPFVGVAGAEPLIWTYGHRNPFGLSVHPATGQIYITENGNFRSDELNRLVRGGNYGWPYYEGREPAPDPATQEPLFTEFPEPSYVGDAFYSGSLYPARYRNAWFVGDWNRGRLTLVDLDASGSQVIATATFHTFPGPVFDVADGPDGNLWVLHSNTPQARGADRITRIVYDPAPRPSLNLSAPTGRAIGGSLTAGVVGTNGDRIAAWLSFSKLANPVPTPWGDLWVTPDLLLPEFSIVGDGRGYRGFPVIDNPALAGQTLHAQAGVLSGATLVLTAPTEYRF